MSDLDNFKAMLDRAGLLYKEEAPAEWRFLRPGPWARRRDRGVVSLPVATLVDVEGHFYESLSAAFDDDGALIDMMSHVVLGEPSSRAKELWEGCAWTPRALREVRGRLIRALRDRGGDGCPACARGPHYHGPTGPASPARRVIRALRKEAEGAERDP